MKAIIIFILITNAAYSSFFNDSLEVNKEYSLLTNPTKTDAKYIITVSGQYSQWGGTVNKGVGNDAVWYNETPVYGIPMVDNILNELFKDPIWFGDTTLFTIPIINEQFSMKEYLGFRLNGEPLPALERDTLSHTYQIEFIGTGEPLIFELWDYAYDTETQTRESKYKDNNGMLYINIKEVLENKEENCGYKILQNNDLKNTVLLRAKIDEKFENTIYLNGQPTEILNIICGNKAKRRQKNLYLIDNSFSMYNPINIEDLTPKIDLIKYINKGIFNDSSSSYYTFNQDEIKKIDVDQINSQSPKGNTELYSSLIQMIDKAETGSNIILITDSFTSEDTNFKHELIDKIHKRKDLSFYSLVLVNDENILDQNSINEMIYIASQFSLFQVMTINTASQFIESIISLQSAIINDDCCTAVVEIDKCNADQMHTLVQWANGAKNYYFHIPCEELEFSQNVISKRIINNEKIELKGKLIYDVYGNQLKVNSTDELNNGIYLIQDINSEYKEIINIRR